MEFVYSSHLTHHGIMGQKWGKRNGPPYPLDAQDHSASEKKAGWRKSLDNNSGKAYDKNKSASNSDSSKNKGLTKNQKRAIAIGATAVAAALAVYGGYQLYKSGHLSLLVKKGRAALAGELPDSIKRLPISEKLSDTLKNTNPHRGEVAYKNNCSSCGIVAFLRSKGFDVEAKSTGGQMQNLGGVVEECFKGAKVIDGSAIKFGRSRKDAAEMLIRRFGDNADGVCSVQFKQGGGHIFNWTIKDGLVSFFDAQNNWDDSICSKYFWEWINPNDALQIARLDNLDVNPLGILKWVKTK